MGFKGGESERRKNQLDHKMNSTSNGSLFEGLPIEFSLYFKHVQSLGFQDKPDYAYLAKLFRDLFEANNYQYDFVYDWTIIEKNYNVSQASPETIKVKEDLPVPLNFDSLL
jgi:casein kinase I family protein HRR25